MSQGTYAEEPNEERELATEFSPNNKPVLSSLGLSKQEENTHLWVCQVCEAPVLSQMMDLLSSFLQETCCEKRPYLFGISNRLETQSVCKMVI